MKSKEQDSCLHAFFYKLLHEVCFIGIKQIGEKRYTDITNKNTNFLLKITFEHNKDICSVLHCLSFFDL